MVAIKTSKTSSAVKLCNSAAQSDKLLTPYRMQRNQFIKEYTGPYYGTGFDGHDPFNLIFSMVGTLVPNLFFEPGAQVTSNDANLDIFCEMFMLDLEYIIKEINVPWTLRMLLIDSIFGLAISKTALGPSGAPGKDEDLNWLSDPGKVFFERVSLDDYIPDMKARSRFEMSYEGNRYLEDFEFAMNNGMYDTDEIERLKGAEMRKRMNRVSNLGRGGRPPGSDEDFVTEVELANFWLPRQGMMVTVPGDPSLGTEKYIAEFEYDGPEEGPYDHWGFCPVPDNLMPVPLVAAVYDLYVLINKIAIKAAQQADAQKDFVAISESMEEHADAVRDVESGHVLVVPDSKEIKTVSLGGVNADNYKAVAWFNDYYNRIGGNLDLLGGLGPQSNTLGQDEMNRGSASQRVMDWRRQCRDSFRSALKKMAYWELTDPITKRTLQYVDAETALKIPMRWTPEAREMDFTQFDVDVAEYDRKILDPDQEYERMKDWFASFGMPLAQLGGPQGQLLDVERLMRLSAKQAGLKSMNGMFKHGAPTMMAGGSMGAKTTPSPDLREVRRLPAKPPPVESMSQQMGVPGKPRNPVGV